MKRHVLITGASSGIGHSLALLMAEKGFKVSAIARRGQRLNSLAQAQPSIVPVVGDVSSPDDIRNAIEKAKKVNGPVQMAILNAGIYQPVDASQFDLAVFQRHLEVNYMGILHCLDCLIPDMVARKDGHIALMASVAGYRGLPRSAAYGPTKAALQNLAESLYFDLHPKGIKMQVINPGFVDSEATKINDFIMPDLISSGQAARFVLDGLQSDNFEIFI